jgi:hypothetical protein
VTPTAIKIVLTTAGVLIVLGFPLCVVARKVHGHIEKWGILGFAGAIVGLIAATGIGITAIYVQHDDAVASKPPQASTSQGGQKPTASAVAGHDQAAPAAPEPPLQGVVSLPADSPLRQKLLTMEEVCRVLGQPTTGYAWLPGQVSGDSIVGRISQQHRAAATWSCTRNGPKITRDQMSAGCRSQYGPSYVAYTFDADDAYSWFCTDAI